MHEVHGLRIFTGNAHPKLATDIAAELRTPLGEISVKQFSDGEICIKIEESAADRTFLLSSRRARPSTIT